MKTKSTAKIGNKISSAALDAKFENGEDITGFLDLKKATVVQRVNVDFPSWMVAMLDQEANKMNVSRQAIIKMWIRERLDPSHRITR